MILDPLSLNDQKGKSQNIINKKKTIKIEAEKNKQFEVEFINNINTLVIEARLLNNILTEIFSNKFTLEDIKTVKYFSNYFESIDDCLSEMFYKLDKNKTKIILEKNELTVVVPLDSKIFPEIKFPLKKMETNANQKFDDLFELYKKMKEEQEKEVKILKDRINYLEDLLKIKKNQEIKSEANKFDGTFVKIKCFGPSEFDNYIDPNHIRDNRKITFSFSFSGRNIKDIHTVFDSFNNQKQNAYYDNAKNVFARVKNNKLFIDLVLEEEDFMFEKSSEANFLNLFFALGQSLTIKTKAIPKNLFEEFNEEKPLNFILDTELEFENVSPQIQMFTFFFYNFVENIGVNDFTKSLFRDIFLNLMDGNYKYKIPKILVKQKENDSTTKEIFLLFKNIIELVIRLFEIDKFNDYKIIDFNEIDFYFISQLHKSGFSFNFKLPEFNELIDKLIKGQN